MRKRRPYANRRKKNKYHRVKRRKKFSFRGMSLEKLRQKFNMYKAHLKLVGSWTFRVLTVCFLAFVFVWYFGQGVSAVGDSMKPVLSNGDVVLVNRIKYNATTPKRGDIIVFKPKGNENAHYYIKRIVGLPGETVEIIESSVYINGKKLEEDYKTTKIDDVGVVFEEMKLASDEYFVLGDDRENSEDSRNADVGNVKRSYIYGEAWFVVSPKKHLGFVR